MNTELLGGTTWIPMHIEEPHSKMPKETMGFCSQKNCNNYTYLGNGYCLKCWAEGLGFDSQTPHWIPIQKD